MTVGARIKNIRESKGMSQDELAKRMGYKDRSSISKIEKASDDNITLDSVQKFSEVLNCSPLFLMGWGEENNESESQVSGNTEREKKFINLFEQLDEDQQKLVQNMIEAFLSKK